MGVPKEVKTDNGPAYTSTGFAQFCHDFDIVAKTGIPYNPQGQAIVERCHRAIKIYLTKIKKEELGVHLSSPHSLLSLVLYTLNFLTVDSAGASAADRHWPAPASVRPLVLGKSSPLVYGKAQIPSWCGPEELFVFFSQDGEIPVWVPERCVRTVDASRSLQMETLMGNPQLLPSSSYVFSFVYDYEKCQLLATPIYFREDMGIEEPADEVNFYCGK
ncbi:hypothetical protein STEG23_036547, partial [Scotinomys teguina]